MSIDSHFVLLGYSSLRSELCSVSAIEARGASLLYLPPYSPDLNPIEQAFAKLEQLLRGAAARTRETLWNAIGRIVPSFSPGECANYLAHCGNSSTVRPIML